MSPPVLVNPDYLSQFELHCDTIAEGVETMLAQKGRPIAFASRIFNPAEGNYSITERKCLAVIWALDKFRCFFTHITAKVVTDHSAMAKLTHGKGLSSLMVRWCLKLAEYNIVIEHRAGKENAVADALSRNTQEYVEAVKGVKLFVLSSLVLRSREQLIKEQKEDEKFGNLCKYLESPDEVPSANVHILQRWSQSFKLIDGLLFYSKSVNSRGELRMFIPLVFARPS